MYVRYAKILAHVRDHVQQFYSNCRTLPWISFFRVPTEDDEYSINWRNNIVVVSTRDTKMKAIQKDKLKTEHFELNYPQEKMISHK